MILRNIEPQILVGELLVEKYWQETSRDDII